MLLNLFFFFLVLLRGSKCASFLRESTVYEIGNEDYDKQIKVRHRFSCCLSVNGIK